MRLVLGLGNPGRRYARTRHNVGVRVVEELARRHGIGLDRERHRARYGTGRIGRVPVLLATPLTYMNLSGEAARPLMRYHGLGPGEIIVVHDEADLLPGTVRIKQGGGIAGHNGLRSLVEHLGTREFTRVRVGIGRPPGGELPMADWVLTTPPPDEAAALAEGIERAADAVEAILALGVEAAMTRFNRRDAAE
ncbi:MAG: aminoacyl-tRNA hydrolase [Acidobacteriota bacterium]